MIKRMTDKPKTCEILDVRKEAVGIHTITLDATLDASPGQFVMLWIPGIGEKPFSLSKTQGNIEITFDVKGDFTKKLSKMKTSNLVGVRGPYGRGWNLNGAKKVAIVTGGLGMAPLMPVVELLRENCSVAYGTRSKDLIKFGKRLNGIDVIYTTDDGSFGKKCHACDMLPEILATGEYDLVLSCGPELLMKKVSDICKKEGIKCQVSLERYMKCGMGICGSCVLDGNGVCVCTQGPVFPTEELEGTEFGTMNHRGMSGGHD